MTRHLHNMALDAEVHHHVIGGAAPDPITMVIAFVWSIVWHAIGGQHR